MLTPLFGALLSTASLLVQSVAPTEAEPQLHDRIALVEYNLAIASQKLGAAVEALGHARSATGAGQTQGSDPAQEAKLHYNVAVIALNDGNNAIALRELEAAARLAPENALVHYNLAVVLRNLQRPQEALTSLQLAMKLALPPEVKDQADAMLATLVYEREKVEADFEWLREQHGWATEVVCRVGVFHFATEFQGFGCDLTLVASDSVNNGRGEGPRRVTRHTRVLRRIQGLSPTSAEMRSCADGTLAAQFFGASVTLAGERGGAQEQVTIWWQTQPSVAERSYAALERAARSCGAPLTR